MNETATHASSLDWAAIGTNAGVFMLAVMAAAGGFWQALKKLGNKTLDQGVSASGTTDAGARLAGATILENVTLAMWSESNREVAEQLRDLIGVIRENTNELRETRFQVERVRDKLD